MKKILLSSVVLFLSVVLSSDLTAGLKALSNEDKKQGDVQMERSPKEVNVYQPTSADILHFQTQWLKQELTKSKTENLVISPMSLYQALALFGYGLNGDALMGVMTYPKRGGILSIKKENSKELLPNGKALFHIKFNENVLSDDQVRIVNSIWGNSFLSEYIQNVQKYLKAEAKPLPQNTKTINQWIEESTEGKISNMLTEKPTFSNDLFLVNAIYFKAEWFNEFQAYETHKALFKSFSGNIDVDMMFNKKYVDYYEDDKMQAIRLPYKRKKENGWEYEKSNHAMTFILPKEHVVWSDFVEQLMVQDFYLNFLENMPVKIYLPKFKLAYQPDNLVQTLKNMGLKPIFETGAFRGTKEGATLVEVAHKSIISVDEKGTEAAAATVFGMKNSFYLPELKRKDPYFIFKADRPFIFMLDDGLFVGIVNNPNQE